MPLSERGFAEAPAAGRTMAEAGVRFDVAHTSVLAHAVVTCHLALEAMGQVWLPVQRNWRLNERHYGALQGLDKKQTTELHGAEQTKLWRRSYDVPPPPVDESSPEHPINDLRYRLLPPDVLPASKYFADVVRRVLPYWPDTMAPGPLGGRRARHRARRLATGVGDAPRARLRDDSPSSTSPPVRLVDTPSTRSYGHRAGVSRRRRGGREGRRRRRRAGRHRVAGAAGTATSPRARHAMYHACMASKKAYLEHLAQVCSKAAPRRNSEDREGQ